MDYFGIPVRLSAMIPLTKRDENGDEQPMLGLVMQEPVQSPTFTMPLPGDTGPETKPVIYVHPKRIDEFWLWVNAPDVASHPELRAWFRSLDAPKTPKPRDP